MSTRNYISLGIMTGTSLDGLDISIIKSDGKENITFYGGKTYPFQTNLREKLRSVLGSRKMDEKIKIVESIYTDFVIEKIQNFLNKKKKKIDIIGFHGQTITHDPKNKFTWQLGDGQKISNYFETKVVNNFRINDINNGGQGAPLTPIFHKLLKNKYRLSNVAFINLGGISNITFIIDDNLLAYDCSPCCSILNDFIKNKINKEYDKNGLNASKGKANMKIVQQVIKKKFFSSNSPKSLDTYDIKIKDVDKLDIFDGLATLNEFISEAISLSINKFKYKLDKIILLGGGRKNKDLINRIQKKVKVKIFLSEEIGVDGDLIESYAFGYLAIRSLNKDIISFPSTTGVIRPVTGGDIIINKF